ncbi:MAG: SDR family NAD(P)-dependent oxidoreductase [Bacteroidales bacterium]|nr:SDR family NAD(P)-dependent oxidoreductase [Bacteroidales bacterium]
MNTNTVNTQYTIILGAEGELGKAMAREIARKGCNLLLVSTTYIDLQRFAIGLQLKHEIQVNAIKLDLSNQEEIQFYVKRIQDSYEIRALINNITCDWSAGENRCISELTRDDFQTRFRGAVLITRSLLPHMRALASSYIQHIIPFPFRKEQFSEGLQHSVAKMYALTRELEEQLKNTGVLVSMVHPAPIKSLMQQVESFGRIFEEDIQSLAPGLIAAKAVKGMLRGDRLIIPGLRNKVLFYLNRHATSWFRDVEKSYDSGLQPSM